jgi:hypothetical protein
MVTSVAAVMRVAPVRASIKPFTPTDPVAELMVSEPPLTCPLATLPRAVSAIAPEPDTSGAAVVLMAPFVAVNEIAALLVTTAWLTLRSRFAVMVTVAPSTSPRPSTWALTLMSVPAITLSVLPDAMLTIG